MRRRHLLPEAVILALLGLLGWLLVSHPLQRGPRLGVSTGGGSVTKANLARVKKGMTPKEVEAILGPPGNFSKRSMNATTLTDELVVVQQWVTDDGVITIGFGPQEWKQPPPPFEELKVLSKSYDELSPESFH